MNITGKEIVRSIRETLSLRMDVDAELAGFGQLDAVSRRSSGELFALRDHLRGMILAMLSANRPWRPIAANLDRLTAVFGDFRPSFLRDADPSVISRRVMDLGCGNRRIRYQMAAIIPNLATFERIALEFGCIDEFLETQPSSKIAELFANAGSRFKLREIGVALAIEYLKNVGIRAVKPDVHVIRFLGPERLNLLNGRESPQRAAELVHALCENAAINEVEFDNLVWLYCSPDYGSICTAHPRCSECSVREFCQHLAS